MRSPSGGATPALPMAGSAWLDRRTGGRTYLCSLVHHSAQRKWQEVALAWQSLGRLAKNPDTNGDGTVNLDDQPRWVRDALVAELDKTGDGKVDQADLDAFLATLHIPETNDEIVRSFDTNGDGALDFADLPIEMKSALLRSFDRCARAMCARMDG